MTPLETQKEICQLHEWKIDLLESKFNKVEETIDDISDKLTDIQVEVGKHSVHIETMQNDVSKILELLTPKKAPSTETEVKVKIIWGVASAIGLVVLGAVGKLLFGI